MDYDTYISIIVNSSVDDWNVITCGIYGPSYKSKFEFNEVWDGVKGVLTEESHGVYAVYKKDISISLAFGITVNEDFKEDWTNSFPDSHASSHIVDLFFYNTLVERIEYVLVDGCRAKLPLPKSPKDLSVNRVEYEIVKLIDRMVSGEGNFEKYFNRAKLQIAED